jgi:hypothetical protein
MTAQAPAPNPEAHDATYFLERYFLFWHAGPASEEEIVRYFTETTELPAEHEIRSTLQKFTEDKFVKRTGSGQSGDPYIYEYVPEDTSPPEWSGKPAPSAPEAPETPAWTSVDALKERGAREEAMSALRSDILVLAMKEAARMCEEIIKLKTKHPHNLREITGVANEARQHVWDEAVWLAALPEPPYEKFQPQILTDENCPF